MKERRFQTLLTAGLIVLLLIGGLACSVGGSVEINPTSSATQGEAETTAEAPAAPSQEAAPATESAAPAEGEAAAQPTEAGTENGETSGSGETATSEPTPPPAEAQPTATPVPPPTEPPAPPAEGDPLTAASEEIPELTVASLDPQGAGMSGLGTFRQRMTVEFVAQDSGYSGIYRYDADVNTAQQAAHIILTAEGAAVQQLPANQVQAIWIGTRLWIKVGNQPWVPVPESVAAMQFDEQMYTVGDFLPYVQHFERVQPDETVNGIPCVHYTYQSDNLATAYGSLSGHGDIYVAINGGYIVRYTMEGSGNFQNTFQGSGTIHLVYDTYDVGAPINIRPPRG